MACQIPGGIRLVFLPPYTPELQPAETLWALVDEWIIKKHIATIKEREAKIAERCVAPHRSECCLLASCIAKTAFPLYYANGVPRCIIPFPAN
jgi:hypothetical protein